MSGTEGLGYQHVALLNALECASALARRLNENDAICHRYTLVGTDLMKNLKSQSTVYVNVCNWRRVKG